MKANELMIGDWVKLKDAKLGNINFVGPYVQIKSITGRHVLVPNAKGLLEDVTEEYLLPISLTPEILEKNGFVTKDEEGHWTGYRVYHLRNEDGKELFWVCLYHTHHKACEISLNAPPYYICFKYVHQLQNILNVFGINKDIIL